MKEGAPSFDFPGETSSQTQSRYKGKHPVAGFFHVLFKTLGILIYMTGVCIPCLRVLGVLGVLGALRVLGWGYWGYWGYYTGD